GLTALSAEFTIGEGELMAHDVPLGCAPDEYDDLISGTCSHLPEQKQTGEVSPTLLTQIDTRLNQLLNRYVILLDTKVEQSQ
ncbi:hypothetical protein ACBQ65_19400, partial [Escherichia coli]